MNIYKYITKNHLLKLIEAALLEDIGEGDITTDSIIDKRLNGKGYLISKAEGIFCGQEIFISVFKQINKNIKIKFNFKDGDKIKPKDVIAEIEGDTRSILKGERLALNFIQRLSGIATLTNQFVQKVKKTNAKILDTRKTTPLFRSLEKYAVVCGGGENHRFGLYDMVLIKDNHIDAAGGIDKALERVKNVKKTILVETRNLTEVRKALPYKPDIIMLDNMKIDVMKKAIKLIDKKSKIEVSGNVSLDNVEQIAKLGIDRISIGKLTHSANALDISLLLKY